MLVFWENLHSVSICGIKNTTRWSYHIFTLIRARSKHMLCHYLSKINSFSLNYTTNSLFPNFMSWYIERIRGMGILQPLHSLWKIHNPIYFKVKKIHWKTKTTKNSVLFITMINDTTPTLLLAKSSLWVTNVGNPSLELAAHYTSLHNQTQLDCCDLVSLSWHNFHSYDWQCPLDMLAQFEGVTLWYKALLFLLSVQPLAPDRSDSSNLTTVVDLSLEKWTCLFFLAEGNAS